MAAQFSVDCTQCSATLKIRKPELIGKKVRCPKCDTPFVVQAPTEDFESETFYEEVDQFTDDADFEDYGTPLKKFKKKKTSKGKRTKRDRSHEDRKPWGMLLGVFGAGFLLLALIGVGVYFALPFLLSGQNRFAWLPNDMETYVEFRPAEIWKADVMRPIRQTEIGTALKDQLTEKFGMDIEDIDRIVIGQSASQKDPMVIIHTRAPINLAALEQNGKAESYAGRTIYDDGRFSGVLVSSQMLVAGSRVAIEAAIDRDGECLAAEKFAFVPEHGDFIYASASGATLLASGGNPLMNQNRIDPKTVQNSSLVMNFGRNLALNFEVNFTHSEHASDAVKEAQDNLEQAHAMLDAQQSELEEAPFIMTVASRSMVNKVRDMLKTVHVGSWGNQFHGKMQVSGQMVRDFADLIALMAPSYLNQFGDFIDEEELMEDDEMGGMFPFGL